MPRIVVTGRASRELPAERGTVRVSLGLVGERREDVLARATRLHALLVGQAKDLVTEGAATWWSAGHVVAAARDEWLKPNPKLDAVKVTRFWAGAELRVKFRDFARLADWAVQVVQHEGVAVGSVTWALTETQRSAVLGQVRAEAVHDAVTRAQAYAGALGLGPVRLATLYEDGLRPHVGVAATGGLAARAAAAPMGSTGGVEVRPEDIEVTAAVTADFDAD